MAARPGRTVTRRIHDAAATSPDRAEPVVTSYRGTGCVLGPGDPSDVTVPVLRRIAALIHAAACV